ncbi:hypothetical protein M440DRAFT_1431759 [Trichoderma longibrachiatum ATCC 18648]|uniref:Stc1 domain-containing protein n=1 Tax=Trichoderma longibrachiatum ATCC 18648 TaxID=983965 RepID=A0A2T4C0Y3_TRILO|nr:hypothetical protein M440DRAFT_1431759 [Trichoderma longibrachiatum ATCC 18648]
MASKKANGAFNLATKATIPTRFRCKVGGEWKSIDEFSKNQQRFIQSNLTGRSRIDAANSGMTCREHSSGQRTEMTCELCGLVKPLDEFSSSSKRNGSPHCKRCTAWMETQEPEVIPAPLETGHISIEEERGEMWPAQFVDDTDFFSHDVYPQAPVTGLSSLGLDENDVASLLDSRSQAGAPSEYAASEASSSRPLPPHLRGSIAGSKKSLTPSTDQPHAGASSRSSFVQQLPPHLRPFVQQALVPDASSHSAVGSEFGDTGSISTATTAREARAKVRRISFNAWDPKGVAHRAAKTATESSATATSETTESEAGGASLGSHTPEAVAKSKWPKTKDNRMSQTELRQVGTNHHVAARDPGPVRHRPVLQVPSVCCEPDDEDDDLY